VTNFAGEYAKQYDLIHGQKDYKAEVSQVSNELLLRGIMSKCSILDFGCGTGSHAAIFRNLGFDAWGYDQNSDMIQEARKKNFDNRQYFTSNLSELDSNFKVVYSLFDVINYQVTSAELNSFLDQMDSKLVSGGLLILDSWNKEAVKNDPPRESSRSYIAEGREFVRKVYPSSSDNFDTTRLLIELIDERLSICVQSEEHIMRAYSPSELSQIITKKGYADIKVFELSNWNSMPTVDSWRFGLSAIKL
jgi:SAM-dependent methyltransferase